VACTNNGNNEKSATDSSNQVSQDTSNKVSPTQPVPALITGALDTLWTDSLSFASLPKKKIVFSFTFRQLDTLTLHGWAAEKDSIFTTYPDIKLIKGHASALNYGNDMYFANVILKKGSVAQIKSALIQQKAKFVLFAPQIINSNHIGYKVFLSKEHPGIVKVFVAIPTGIDANPSPPKNY
jgi:hypothetical protein